MNDSNARPQAVGQQQGYGKSPEVVAEFDPVPRWDEFMHYLYLPVRIPSVGSSFPRRLWFLERAASICLEDARATAPHLADPYVYLSVRRGFATPGNPLNRPGWHCDDFGGTDLNYVWSDRFPTRYIEADNRVMADGGFKLGHDDRASMHVMDSIASRVALYGDRGQIRECEPNTVYRLDPFVIHDTPIIPAPGGMRSFFKISVSTHRYNLLGNSRNYELDYDWPMHDRAEVRNHANSEADYVPEAAASGTA